MGEDAPDWLRQQTLPAWLVTTNGDVLMLNGWLEAGA